MANIPERQGGGQGGDHPKHQSSSQTQGGHDLAKPGSMDQSKAPMPPAPGSQPAPYGQPGIPQGQQGGQPNPNQRGPQGQQQPAPAWPQTQLTDTEREQSQKRQQEAWDLAAQREKDNNPATKPARTYSGDAPGMHPANQPAPDTKLNKATRLDLEDITGNPGHRGVNPDAPAGSINGPGVDRTGRFESINEPSHVDQNYRRGGPNDPQGQGGQMTRGSQPPRPGDRTQPYQSGGQPQGGERQMQGAYPVQQNPIGVGSINEPEGSQVIPPGAGQGAGGEAGGIGTEYEHPDIESLEPDEVELGEADTEVTITGTGFTDKSTVLVEGTQQPATFVSATELKTTMKPGDYTAAGVVEVVVANGGYKSEGVEFEFLDATEPASQRRSKRTKPKPQGKGKGKR